MLHVYTPSQKADMCVLRWYAYLCKTGDMSVTFAKTMEIASNFIAYFQQPQVLFVDLDENEDIWFALWFEPVMNSAAYVSLWIREDKRHTKAAVYNYQHGQALGLQAYPLLLGITKHEKILDEHKRGGYTVLGKLPKILDGEDVWLAYLTKESFEARKTKLYDNENLTLENDAEVTPLTKTA